MLDYTEKERLLADALNKLTSVNYNFNKLCLMDPTSEDCVEHRLRIKSNLKVLTENLIELRRLMNNGG
jgi:hypothetical protein